MTYRDETLVLRQRLLTHEAHRAKLEGQAEGLAFRIAEIEADEDRVAAEINQRAFFRRAVARPIGLALGVLTLLAVGIVGLFIGHIATDFSAVLNADPVFVNDIDEQTGCTIEVNDRFLRSTEAAVVCDGERIYEGTPNCQEEVNGLECWDHQLDSSFVMAERLGVAIVLRRGDVHRLLLLGD